MIISKTCFAGDDISVIDSNTWKKDSSKIIQDLFDVEEKYRVQEYVETQGNLPDEDRKKRLSENRYWLVNKEQNLWVGVFNGKQIKVPAGVYINQPKVIFLPEKIVRVKRDNKISQFILNDSENGYPSYCFNRHDGVLKDAQDYMVLYAGCAYNDKVGSQHLSVFYTILFYSKIFDTMLKLDEFQQSALQGIDINSLGKSVKKTNDYYVDSTLDTAFKFIAKDQVVIIDEKTGKAKFPKKDGNGNSIAVEEGWIMLDESEEFKKKLLNRSPEVIEKK
jgi:hypothetical protein